MQGAFRDKGDFKRRTDVDIDISVGRRLPRDWHFVPVPIAVIEIVPEYRDYVFVYVEDEYVICDPVTYEVVAVIPAGGGGRTYAGGGSGGPRMQHRALRLSEDQRELILQSVRLGREVDVADLEVGWSVPQDIELEKFPTAVLSEAGELAPVATSSPMTSSPSSIRTRTRLSCSSTRADLSLGEAQTVLRPPRP